MVDMFHLLASANRLSVITWIFIEKEFWGQVQISRKEYVID